MWSTTIHFNVLLIGLQGNEFFKRENRFNSNFLLHLKVRLSDSSSLGISLTNGLTQASAFVLVTIDISSSCCCRSFKLSNNSMDSLHFINTVDLGLLRCKQNKKNCFQENVFELDKNHGTVCIQ